MLATQITEANATNEFIRCSNYTYKNNDTKENTSSSNLCDQIPNKSKDITNENVASTLHANETLNNKLLTAIHLDGINMRGKEESKKVNLGENTDSLMKYVYKKTDKPNLENKNKGHSKNSILRKKRSLKEGREPSAFFKSVSPAAYRNSHNERFLKPKDIKREIDKNVGFGDFSIESLDIDLKLPQDQIKDRSNNDYFSSTGTVQHPPKDNRSFEQQRSHKINKSGNNNDSPYDIASSKHSLPIKKDNRSYEEQHRDKIDREEKHTNNKQENFNEHRSDLENSNRFRPIIEQNRNYEQRSEIVDIEGKNKYKPTERSLKESDESKENYDNSNEFSKELLNDYRDTENSKTINHPKNIHKHNVGKNNYQPNEDQYKKEISFESSKPIEHINESYLLKKPNSDVNNEDYIKNYDISKPPKRLLDVDLNDFSFERIQLNDKGQVEPLKEPHNNYDSTKILHAPGAPSQLNSEKNNDHRAALRIENNSSERTPIQQPVRINDEEVKPVVELNSENDSSESNEENPARYKNTHLRNSNKYSSGEDLHRKKINDELNENSGEKANVKHQFERIPLNYNHDVKSQQEINKKEIPAVSKETSNENINDGTLDSLVPKKNNYDEHLKTKFGDVSITLPDINLPDDILSYARLGAPKENEGKYYYGEEDSGENSNEYRKDPYAADKNDYYNIHNEKIKDHENYKKSNLEDDDDDDVDLYEKFVRERFGKESSSGKKSEKLQAEENRPLDSKLLETVQKILKKTEKVKDDAEKSGDPNAGYMWTLEYGQDL